MTTDLWKHGACDAAAHVAKGDVSARELVASTLARIADINPRINALPVVLAEEALAAADAADARRISGKELPPLHGVPVTVKINTDQKGQATTDGAAINKDRIAEFDSPVVANLRKAGAIIIGRSNTPAFSMRWFTDNELHGRTFNPWARDITPGGSSGGAAAAVATGMGALAHGNDFGGSVRYPAYACGVVGLRASVGRIPSSSDDDRAISFQMMSTQGVLARSIADARLALAAMSASDARDPLLVPAPLEQPHPSDMRIAMCSDFPGHDVDPAVRDAVVKAGAALQGSGFIVEEATPPHFDEASAMWRTLVYADQQREGFPYVMQHGDAAARRNMELVYQAMPDVSRDQYLDALARRFIVARAWSEFFDRYPVLLMPVSFKRPVPIDTDLISATHVEELISAQSPMQAISMLGLPGLSVPTGLVECVPMGVQLVATKFREDLCLHIGAALEDSFGALTPMEPKWT
jgi:amidase